MNKNIYFILIILPLNLLASETILSENKIHADNVDSLCLKNKAIISASFDGSIKKTISNKSEIIGRHKDWVRKLICADSNIISASNDGEIAIWKNSKKIRSVQAHTWWVTDIALSNDKIISVSLDESVKVWSYPELTLLYSHKIHGSNKHHSVIVNNAKAFIGSTKGILFVLDLNKLNMPNKIWIDYPGGSTLTSSAKSNKHVFFGTSNGFIAKIAAFPPYKLNKKKISDFAIKGLAQSKGILYAGDDNGVIRKLNISNFKTEIVNNFPDAVRAITIDNGIIYSAFDNGYIRTFSVKTRESKSR